MTKHEEKALRISGDFFSHQRRFFFFGRGGPRSRDNNKKQRKGERERIISKNENIIDTIDD